MAGCNSIKHDFHETLNMHPNLNAIPLSANISNDQQFRLNKIDEIKDYFIIEIRERELMTKVSILLLLNILMNHCFISSNWQYFHYIICNCYWSACWNYECKL